MMKMRRQRIWRNLMILCVFGLSSLVRAQFPENVQIDLERGPAFFYDAVTWADTGFEKSVIHVSVKVQKDELQFVNTPDGYQAAYELTVLVLDAEKNQVDQNIQTREVKAFDYTDTNAQFAYSLAETEFVVPPGQYTLHMSVHDLDSRKTGHKKISLNVSNFMSDDLNISALVLSDSVYTDEESHVRFVPSVAANYTENQELLYLWFQIYNWSERDSVRVLVAVLDHEREIIREEEHFKVLDDETTSHVVPIPRGELKGGRYTLELIVGKGRGSVRRTRSFSVRWSGMPNFATDLDRAVEQLKYIEKGSAYKKLKNAKGEEKRQMFLSFWRSKDPTSGTEQNELMEEYYRRVAYSDATFSSTRDGWKTDRGMIYIILGPPTDVERRHHDSGNKPYEVWYYSGLNRSFVFVDQNGYGDFRLITPNWDVLRLRD